MGSSFESILAEGSLSYLSVYPIFDIYTMIGTLVLCSLFAASQQMSLAHYENSRYNEPVHHAPGHGDVHVSGRYQQDNQVHVSGVRGATRIVDSGNAYHATAAPKPAAVVTEPYRPAPTHSPLNRPAYHAPAHSGYKPGGGDVLGASHYKPGHYAPAHGDVQVSGGYQQDSKVHVSGTAGATRIVDSGSSYHAHQPTVQNPYRPAPVHPYLYRPVHYAPVNHEVHASGSQQAEENASGLRTIRIAESDTPVHHTPVHGEVHVSGSHKQVGDVHVSGAGATRVVDSGSSYHAYVPKPAVQNPYRPAPVPHQPLYRPVHHAPVHGEVHVSGSYKQVGDVHVSGAGATRVVDSGSSYHAHVPKPAVQNPYRPAHVHKPLYRPVHHAPVHREVHVSGRYKQAGDVHVSGVRATRVVDSGSHHRYQPAPVMYNPQPDLPAPVVHKPYVPAPVFLFRRARSVPDHQEEDVHVSGSYEQENEVHVSGSAGTTVILDYDDHSYGHSSYAHEPAPEYESHHAPADDVNVSGSYKQESEVHVSGAGATRVSDSTNSYEHAPAPAYDSAHVQQQETVDVHVSDADVHVSDADVHVSDADVHVSEADVHVSGAGGSVSVEEFNHSSYEMPADQPAAGQVHQSGHYVEYNAEPAYQPFEPVVIPYSEDLVPAYDMYADHYEAHVPTLYHDEHYVAEDNDIETFYES